MIYTTSHRLTTLLMLTSTLRSSVRVGLRQSPRFTPLIARRGILEGWGVPQPPGNIVGTVNEAVPTPPPSHLHGSYHWDFERLIAISIVPLTVLPLATGHLTPTLDALLGGLLVAHCHVGFSSCITDYIPKRKFPRGHGVFMAILYLASGASLYGVYKLETEEEGLVGAVSKIWNA